MNWDWIAGSAYQASHFQRIKNRTDTNAQKTAGLNRRVDELERELDGMRIVHRAFIEVIAEKLNLEDEEVEAKLQELIAEASRVLDCPSCKRPRGKRAGPCMYCGAPEPKG